MGENLLWNYSLEVYRKPNVEAELLQLQDRFGADVNVLLSCLWVASQGLELDDNALSELLKISASCQAQCIMPLRSLRRGLKGLAGAEGIREEVKSLELKAEQWQQDLFYQQIKKLSLTTGDGSTTLFALQNLQCYTNHLQGVEWDDLSGIVSDLVSFAFVENNG